MTEQGAEVTTNGSEPAETAETTQVPDKLLESLEAFKTDVSGRLDALQQRIPEPAEEEPEAEDDPGFEFTFSDEDYGEDGELSQEAQMRALNELVRQQVAEAQRPHLEREAKQRRMSEADALEKQYPDLAKEDVQDAMIEKVVAFANELGVPELAREPKLLEIVYLATEAEKVAADERSGDEQEFVMERSGAARAAASGQDDTADRIVGAVRKQQFRLGS